MSEHDRRRLLTATLLGLAAGALTVGVPATVAPHAFYAGFPWFSHWVDRLPPYNQHLTTDVGELQLAFGLLFLWAAWRPSRTLVVPVSLAWALSQSLHAGYHLLHLQGFSAADATEEMGAFVLLIGGALLAVWLSVTARASTVSAR